MSRLGNLGARLYRGDVGYDFIGKRKFWYGVSILITITAIVGLVVRGLNMGIEFQGGAVLTTPKTTASIQHTTEVVEKESGRAAIVQQLGSGGMRIQIAGLDTDKSTEVKESISKELKVDANQIDTQLVGPSWGEQIANKAWLGLGIFMVLVVIYLAIAFEWRMALAALIALIHDITITVGIYSLVGFEVTPGTVIGLLTILGYSLYDTVVVFDSLRESSRSVTKQTRYTYSEIANRSINSTLVRSINTTVVALLPVAGLLFIGGGLLGGGMLNDIALSLFVGLAAGAYSSIFIATPLVADFKERQPEMKALARRVRSKRLKNEDREAREDEEDGFEGHGPSDGFEGPGHGGVQAPDAAATAAAGVVGPRGGSEAGSRSQRRQPPSRSRSRNRPSGKRR
ncbi:protein translocase subunit SecF [Streptomyces bathyalis]|uniref:Protein-export membrane protein SecF n=1 Tax=Streptomyces bathyalis TaxID=2710756 RepID=A0A7T1TBB1_9ACTN|nr:protein translocase subunit SecF [Streptomyces bathyalis]QPP09839.1 protein translocase subunit SecF [Streptomyces bathyalis]